MTKRVWATCPECEGKGSVDSEVRVSTMNSGGFAYIDLQCETCKGEGEVEIDVSANTEEEREAA